MHWFGVSAACRHEGFHPLSIFEAADGKLWSCDIKPEILITQSIVHTYSQPLIDAFVVHDYCGTENRSEILNSHAQSVRAIAGGNVDAALLDRLPNLELISNFGVGYDSIDVKAALSRGVSITYTPNVLNEAMAEITIGLMVASARNLVAADRYVRDGKWEKGPYPLQRELNGGRAGIIGLGRIGKSIAERCIAMGMKVAYHGRRRQADQPYDYYDSALALAQAVAWLVVVAPGGPETEGMVSREVLEALGPEGTLVNMARGTLVDEIALIDLLQSGGLGWAALDVFAQEPHVPEALRRLENVVLSPHQGSATIATRAAMGKLVVDNIKAHFAGEPLLTPIPEMAASS